METKRKSGFTLIELLVVISVLGVMAAVILVSLNSARVKGREVRRISDLNQLQKALELYYDTNSTYPRYDVGSPSCLGWASKQYTAYTPCWDDLKIKLSPYVSNLPQDPLFLSDSDQAYWYRTLKSGQGYYIFMRPELDKTSQTQGEACHDGYGPNTYCVGSNWQ